MCMRPPCDVPRWSGRRFKAGHAIIIPLAVELILEQQLARELV